MSENIKGLVQRLGDRNTKSRLDAANELARLGDSALDAVTDLMSHADYTLRRIAAYVLGKIKSPSSVEILIEALGDDNADVRKSAAQALNRIGKPSIESLIRSLGNISKDVRASAVWSISKMGATAVPALVDALRSEVKDVRASAVWALEKIGMPSVQPLIDLIEDPEKNVMESSIWGLARIGLPAIKKLAEKWSVRIGSDAIEGESETDSVDIDDLLSGGVNSIKQWIKFMLEHKKVAPVATPDADTTDAEPPQE